MKVLRLILDTIVYTSIVYSFLHMKSSAGSPIELANLNIKKYSSGEKLAQTICDTIGVSLESDRDDQNSLHSVDLKKFIVGYDCDDVLHKNMDATLQKTFIWNFVKENNFSKEQIKTLIRGGAKDLVEPEILKLFLRLKSLGVLQFVCTQCSSDEKTRVWRSGILHALGYGFDWDILGKDPIEIQTDCQLVLQNGQSDITPPIWENGILYTGSTSEKGEVLKSFLYYLCRKLGTSLSDYTVFFIDDNCNNVVQVGRACKEVIYKFYGCNYTAAVDRFDKKNEPQSNVVDLQVQVLRKLDTWLPDRYANALILCNNCHNFNSTRVKHGNSDNNHPADSSQGENRDNITELQRLCGSLFGYQVPSEYAIAFSMAMSCLWGNPNRSFSRLRVR